MEDHELQKTRIPSGNDSNEYLSTVSRKNTNRSDQLNKNFSFWSILGIGFSILNSWFSISTALIDGLSSGGPVQLVYGLVIVTIVYIAIGVCLAELASAMPHAGGQYYWTRQLASPRYARFASYLTGWVAWAGSLCTCASLALGVSSLCVGCIQMAHPEMEISNWMVFVGYQVVNIFCALFNVSSNPLPMVSLVIVFTSIVSLVVIILAVPISSPTHPPSKIVFTAFYNSTGWSSNAMAYIVGLITPTWAFSGLDAPAHMAEEVANPERVIPRAIMATVGVSFVTSWLFSIAMMFSFSNYDAVANTATGVPILELFAQALGNKAGAIVLCSLVILTGCGCLITSHTWQARLCWSFARDNGLPGSFYLKRVHKTLRSPLYAHFTSCAIVGVMGCIFMASDNAFSSLATACMVLLYISYAIPVIFLLDRGRSSIRHGPFWLGKFGLVCNVILLAWLVFTLVFFSFPVQMPATADNMNYVAVVYIIVLIVIVSWWYISADNNFDTSSLDS